MKNKDMTSGSIPRHLISFSIPLLITSLFQFSFSFLDSIMMGQFVGVSELGAVSCCGTIINFFMLFSNGMGIGIQTVVGNLYGGKHYRSTRTAFTTVFVILGVLSVLSTVLGISFSGPLLRMISTPEELLPYAETYMRLYFSGLTLIIFTNGINGMFHALGETRIPMLVQIINFFVNVGLDLLLLRYFKLGVAGVALAGIGTRAVALTILLIFFIRRARSVAPRTKWFRWDLCKRIFVMGLPACLGASVNTIGDMMLRNLTNSFGANVISALAICGQLNNICFLIVNAICAANNSFVAQNYGAHRIKRIKKCVNMSFFFTCAYSAIIILVFTFFKEALFGIFIGADTDPVQRTEIFDFAGRYITVINMCYIIYALGHLVNEVMRGIGKTIFPFFTALVNLGMRLIFSYALVSVLGESVIYWNIPVGWLCGYMISIVYYFSGGWVPHHKLAHQVELEAHK